MGGKGRLLWQGKVVHRAATPLHGEGGGEGGRGGGEGGKGLLLWQGKVVHKEAQWGREDGVVC
jgi:hypothetical protein